MTGVGLTALGVTACRAIESDRPDGLVSDPYAEAFVAAAGTQMPTRARAAGNGGVPWESMATYMGIRCCRPY
ncbi:MAG: class I SAM-dependent methyltransferase [Nocardioidaceae bacterium]